MMRQNHLDIRHAFQMSHATGSGQSDDDRFVEDCLAKMCKTIRKGQTVIITNSQDQDALEIRNAEELWFYKKGMLGLLPKELAGAMSQAKLQKGMSEVNMNASSLVIHPGEPRSQPKK